MGAAASARVAPLLRSRPGWAMARDRPRAVSVLDVLCCIVGLQRRVGPARVCQPQSGLPADQACPGLLWPGRWDHRR
jgi:hypothetical protein